MLEIRIGTVLEAAPIPMVLIGADARIAQANARAVTLLGADMVGRHHAFAMRQAGLVAAIEVALNDAKPGVVAQVAFGGSHETLHRVTVTPIALPDGPGAVCAFEDLTEQEQISQIRRDFVANVSHELRTPLTALIGFIETLRGAARDDPAARERFLTIMDREANRMNRLVQDLLSLSRVESEERRRPTEQVDVTALVGMAIAALRPLADDAGVRLEVTGGAAPLFVQADPDQLMQVFDNLIENAVKYGGAGNVVTIALDHDPSDTFLRGPSIRVTVIDRGEGIDPVHIPRLTERFYRVDTHRSREKGGTGLGLAIVKHIVNRHRGRLKIDSAPGQGSRFSVVLPAS